MAQKERERKKRKNRKYGQAKLKHSKRGVLSCVLSGIVCCVLLILLATSYYSGGTGAPIVGGFGLVALILAICGLYFGMKGFNEREKDYLTCKIGVSFSSVLILGFIIIFCRGLF